MAIIDAETETPLREVPIDPQMSRMIVDNNVDHRRGMAVLSDFAPLLRQAQEMIAESSTIVVTDPTQVSLMERAAEHRNAIRKVRTATEKVRVDLKSESLRTGKMIDGMANIVKGLCEQEEARLQEQADYARNIEKARMQAIAAERSAALQTLGCDPSAFQLDLMSEAAFEQLLAGQRLAKQQREEAARKAEEERIAKEQADREERERIKAENERLRREAQEREEKERTERAAREAEEARRAKEQAEKDAQARAEREAAEAAARAERERLEAEARKEREAREAAEAEANRAKAEQARREEEERQRQAAAEKARQEAAERARRAPDRMKVEAVGLRLEEIDTDLERIAETMSTAEGRRAMVDLRDYLRALIAEVHTKAKAL